MTGSPRRSFPFALKDAPTLIECLLLVPWIWVDAYETQGGRLPRIGSCCQGMLQVLRAFWPHILCGAMSAALSTLEAEAARTGRLGRQSATCRARRGRLVWLRLPHPLAGLRTLSAYGPYGAGGPGIVLGDS